MIEPYMQRKDMMALDAFFERFNPRTVLEWGAGGSTIFFPKKHKSIEWWYSIEHDSKWVSNVQKELPDNVVVHFFPSRYVLNQVTKRIIDYADFIIIDGIAREECLTFANVYCNDNALVFLHDADRPQYINRFKEFPFNKQVTKGRVPYENHPPGFFKRDGLRVFWKSPNLSGEIDGILENISN